MAVESLIETRETGRNFSVSYYIRAYKAAWRLERNIHSIKLNLILWTVLFVTNIIDIIITYYAFAKGAVEANPAMYLISKHFGDVAITFYKGFFLGVLFILLPFIKKRLQKFLIFACIVYILLTLSHLIRF